MLYMGVKLIITDGLQHYGGPHMADFLLLLQFSFQLLDNSFNFLV